MGPGLSKTKSDKVNVKLERNFFFFGVGKNTAQRERILQAFIDPSDKGVPENVKLFISCPITSK